MKNEISRPICSGRGGLRVGGFGCAEAPGRCVKRCDALKDVMGTSDKAIPEESLNKAYCVIITVSDLEEGRVSFSVESTARDSSPAARRTASAG